MQPTVIDLVLDRFQQVVISDRVFARFRRRTGNEQDSGFIRPDKVGELRVVFQPLGSLLVPIGDFGAERVGLVRVGFLFGFIVVEDLGDVESGVVVGLAIGLGFGLSFFEDAVGLHAPPTRVEVVAELVEVLLRGSEFTGSDSAT